MATPRAAKPRDLAQELKDLKRSVRSVSARVVTREQLTVAGGDFTVTGGDLTVDGGQLLLVSDAGITQLRVGPQELGDRGITLSRDDGTLALRLAKPFNDTDPQQLMLFDGEGHTVVAEEPFGDGLAVPFFELPMTPVVSTPGTALTYGPHGPERVTSSGTFVDLFRWRGYRQNQWCRPEFHLAFSDTTTAAELQVVDGAGTVLDGFFQPPWTAAVAAGTTAAQVIAPPYGLRLPGLWLTQQTITVQARITAGAGTATVAVRQSTGGPP